MELPDGVSEDAGHTATAEALVLAAGDALRADDPATASALTALAQVHAALAQAEIQQQMLWVAGDIRYHLEALRLDSVNEISRALRDRPA